MPRYVFFIRNNDIYNIGVADDIKSRMKILMPTEVIAILEIKNSSEFINKLTTRYSSKRIPETEYFRLSKSDVDEWKKLLVNSGAINKFGSLSSINIFAVLAWWLTLSGLICWFLIRPLFGGNLL